MITWPLWKRIGFRFLFAYLVLYSFPFPLDFVPFAGDRLVLAWMTTWEALSKPFFHAAPEATPSGSGDTTWNYVLVACFLAVAAIATLIWSVLDRQRPNYVRLHQYLHAYVRFVLAAAMLQYGIAKVIPTQFPPPPLDRLVQTYGDSSPMGILWTFMGTSVAYTIFTGAAEMLGGLLLIARRTSLLGALVSIGVLSNIVALNFFYDVPVKLYSLHLLMMAVFVAAPDARKLLDFFILRPPEPLFRTRALHITSLVLRTVVVATIVYLAAQTAFGYIREMRDVALRSPLRGVWNVDVLDVDGASRPPLVTDASRWRRFVFDYPGRMSIFLMSDERLRYSVDLDPKQKSIRFTNRYDPKDKFALTYLRPDGTTLQLDGIVAGRKIHALCKLSDEKQFLLLNRGFHWINEKPFNR
jgi:hypothetical protein